MKRLYVYTIGDASNGMGHISRELVLARQLLAHGVKVTFLDHADTPGHRWLCEHGDGLSVLGTRFPDDVIPFLLSAGSPGDAILVDIEQGPTREMLDALRSHFRHVIVVAGNGYTLQDYAAVVDLADLEIYQGLDAMPGRKAVSGAEFILIDPAFRDCRFNAAGHICVNWGGSDPHNLTRPSIAALAGIDRRVVVIVGPAARFEAPIALPDNVELVCAPPSLRPYLDGAALFAGAFGTVVWEACAAGIPSVMLGWSGAHVTAQARLQALGVGRNLGLWDAFDKDVFRVCVESFVGEAKLLPRYSKRARELVDGGGAARVAARIEECLR